MKILITSGGTSEKIDQVRSITNHSTGRLGKIIAEKCLEAGHQVTLITTAKAVKPEFTDKLAIQMVTDVEDLFTKMKELVPLHDVLIHSMAVSDYTPVYMTGLEEVQKADDIRDFLHRENKESKISSQDDYQLLFLRKTPKIIGKVKEWNPSIMLIGFKLLVQVSKEELIQVARASLVKNQADIIVANDLADISDQQHQAYLISQAGLLEARTKEEIASLLLEEIEKEDRL